jgi:probable phosphoglycerate mutase
LLIRHAVNDFVKTGRMAGWTPGVHLNEEGLAQAAALGQRLAETKIDAIYSSPLERTVETAQAILAYHPHLSLTTIEDVGEVRIGEWQGMELAKVSRRKQWLMVQAFPSRTTFPNGETFRAAQMRAVDALERLVVLHPRGRVAVVSHADIIKLVLTYYLGMPLDMFQRINVSTASISAISVGYGRIMVGQINETSFLPPPPKGDGSRAEIRSAIAITVDAVGEPGSRVFYLQIQHGDDAHAPQVTTLTIEKTQALMLAERIDQLFAGGIVAPPPEATGDLLTPEPVTFRAGNFSLQYDQTQDRGVVEITELLGADQGTPRTLTVWATRGQLSSLSAQAKQVASRGRPE